MIGKPAENAETYMLADEVDYLLSLPGEYENDSKRYDFTYVSLADYVLTHTQGHLYDIQGLKRESMFINSDEYLDFTWKHHNVIDFIGPVCCATFLPWHTPEQIIGFWKEDDYLHQVLLKILN